MKKIAVFAVCLLVLAAVIRGLAHEAGFGPTILTVTVVAQDGTDITSDVRLLVGGAADGARTLPTLGNIAVVRPKEPSRNQFEVPYDRDTAVFVFAKDKPPQQFTFRLSGGEYRSETITLETGIVNLFTTQTPGSPASQVVHQSGGPEGLGAIDVPGNVRLDLPVGEHSFRTARDQQTVTVTAGSETKIVLDDLQGTAVFISETNFPWHESYPPVEFFVTGGPLQETDRTYRTPELRLPFGRYTVVSRIDYFWNLDDRKLESPPRTFEVDAQTVDVQVPATVQVIAPDMTEWNEEDGYLRVVLYSTSDPGKPFAAAVLRAGLAPLVFITPPEEHTFAIAVQRGDDVLSLHDIGALQDHDALDFRLEPGGDSALCVAITTGLNCADLMDSN